MNAGRSTASDLGIRGEYPQRSSLADMDSTSQFEQDLSVGNLSVPQIRASPSSAMSHEVVDRSERGFGCMYSSRSALRPFGRPRKAHASVSFSPRVSFWFPLRGQSRLCQKDVFLVGPAVADGCLISTAFASSTGTSQRHVGLRPPEVALVVPEAGPSYGLPVQRVGFRPPEVVPPVLCTVPLLALPEEHARVRDIGCSHVAKGFGGGCLTDDPSDVIFMDSFIPDPVDGPSAHGSILRDITNGARGDVGVQRHGEFHGPCGRRFESGSQFGPKDLQVGFQSPALTQSDAALVSSHAGSLLSKGGSCRTLSGDSAPNASTVLSSSAAPAGPPFKRPRALSKSKPHSRCYDARAHSRLLACTGAPGTSSEDDAPFGWELGRKKRSTAPNVDTSQPAAQRTSGTQGVQPWAEQPVPGAPAVQVVSGSASSTTNTAPFSVFDYAAGAAVKPRPPGLTAEQCLRRAISDSYVANPIGRLLNTEVPGWPTPQALVFEYRVFRTHIACVVVIAGFFENPFVLQVPLHSTMHRVLALTPVGGDLALGRCQVDNAPIHCDAFLPEDIDYVFFEVTARPVPRGVHLVEQRPFVSVTELPEAALGQASSSSTDVALGLLPTRPATPPIPDDPWDPGSDSFSSSHSGSDWASRLPSFTVFDVVHHVRILEAHGPLTLANLAAVAVANTPELRGPFGYRLLRSPVAGYPAPHVVIWEEPAEHSRTFPIFHFGAPKGVCTVCAPTRTSAYQVAYLAERSCALSAIFRRDIARLDASLLFDGASVDPHTALEVGAVDSATFTQLPPRAPGLPLRPDGVRRIHDTLIWCCRRMCRWLNAAMRL